MGEASEVKGGGLGLRVEGLGFRVLGLGED